MFNGQNFANGFAQGQQHNNNNNNAGGGGGGSAGQGLGQGSSPPNPQLQALLQQQQMQQLRWQQMQAAQAQQSAGSGAGNGGQIGGQGMPSAGAPHQFLNPAAFLNQAAAGGNAMLSQQGGAAGGFPSTPSSAGPSQGGMPFGQQALMPGMSTLNPQQLQAIMAMSAQGGGGGAGAAGMGGGGGGGGGGEGMFNPQMMMNNQQPQQQSQQQQQQQMMMMMAALQQQQQQQQQRHQQQQQQQQQHQQQLASSSSSSNMVDPSTLQSSMGMGAGGNAGRGMPQFPPGAYGMPGGQMNGSMHQQRPSIAGSIASQDAGRSTPDPFKSRNTAGPSKAALTGGAANRKARTPSIKTETSATPLMGAAAIPGAHAGQFVASPLPVGAQGANNESMQQQQQQQHQQQGQHQSPSVSGQQRPNPPLNPVIAAWRPSLSSDQQLEVMTKVWKYSQANSIDPIEVLRRMRLVYVRGDVLPGAGYGRVIAPKSDNPRSGMALITFDEARLLSDFVQAVRPGQETIPIAPYWLDQQQQQQQGDRPPQAYPPQGPAPGSSFPPQSPAPGTQHGGQDPMAMLQQQAASRSHPSSGQDNRPESRSGYPGAAGAMGPPMSSAGPGHPPTSAAPEDIRRQSVAPGSADARQRSVAPTESSPHPMQGAVDPMNRPGMQLPPGQGAMAGAVGMGMGMGMPMQMQMAQGAAMPVPMPGGMPMGMQMPMNAAAAGPSTVPGMGPGGMLAAQQGYVQSPSHSLPQSLPSQQEQQPLQPDLPPVHGGTLPATNAQGYPVSSLNTQITPLPNLRRPSLTREDLHGAFWQPFTEKDEEKLIEIMKRDAEYAESVKSAATQRSLALRQRVEEIQPHSRRAPDGSVIPPEHLHWWERADEEGQYQPGRDGPFKIVFPDERRMDLQIQRGGRRFTTSAYLERLKRRQLSAIGDKWEDLVPIRLEIDHEGWKLRDTFTWNASDDLTSHDEFSKNLCEDYGLPEGSFVPLVREAIQAQISEYLSAKVLRPQSAVITAGEQGARVKGGSRGLLSKEELKWWRSWRGVVEELQVTALGGSAKPTSEEEKAERGSESKAKASGVDGTVARTNPELRINIKLDITVGAMNLLDQFDWDILDETSSPEEFAAAFAADLGLAGEFKTAIAHSIREQVEVHLRSLALAGHPFDGTEVLDDELKGAFLPGVQRYSVTRVGQEVEDHTPRLLQLTEAEVDRQERDRERDSKRKKRQTRGRRGVNMPDREPLKTQRTPAITGLQAAQIEAAGGAAAVAAAAGASSILGGSGAEGLLGVRTSTRRAAAAATANMQAMSEFDTPTPAPEARPSVGPSGTPAKRQRLEDYSIHFKYPGGLGRDDPGEPLYAPASGDRLPSDSVALVPGGLDVVRGGAQSADSASRTRQHSPNKDASAKLPTTLGSANASTNSTPKFRPDDNANQHPNIFNGQWHCSNCGCPGWLLTTRRKGPRGEKTLCGPCGKFYHRFRRMKQANYTRDEAFHRNALGLAGLIPGAAPPPMETDQAPGVSLLPGVDGDGDGDGEARDARDSGRLDSEGRSSGARRAVIDDDEDDEEDEQERDHSRGGPGREEDDIKSTTLGAPSSSSLKQTSRPDSLPATRLASPDLPFMPVGSPDDSDSDTSQSPRSPRASRRSSPRKAGPPGPGLGGSASAGARPFLPPGVADSRGDFKINGAAGGGGGSTSSASSMSVSPEKRTHPLPSTSLGNDAAAAGPSSSSWSSAGLAPPPGAAGVPALGRRDSAYSALAAGGSAPAESPASSSHPSALHPSIGGTAAAGSAGGAGAPTPPSWLTSALDALRSKYTSDRFDLRAKAPPPTAPGAPPSAGGPGTGAVEWRIKCLDCPGKLYTPGPGESLTNFEVHIKNRVHRGAVSARVDKDKERAQGGS